MDARDLLEMNEIMDASLNVDDQPLAPADLHAFRFATEGDAALSKLQSKPLPW